MSQSIVQAPGSHGNRIRTANLPQRRDAAQRDELTALLGSLSRRFAHFTSDAHKSRAASLRRLADDTTTSSTPRTAIYHGLAELPTLPAIEHGQSPLPPCDPRLLPSPIPADMPKWVREECRRLSLPADLVDAAYAHLAAAEAQTIRRREMRQQAWIMHNANHKGCHDFWRAGFRTRYGKRVDAHDYTIIPRYDQLHGEVCGYYPEWTGREYEFFCELLAPLPRLTPARELWQAALAAVQEHAGESTAEHAAETTSDYQTRDF